MPPPGHCTRHSPGRRSQPPLSTRHRPQRSRPSGACRIIAALARRACRPSNPPRAVFDASQRRGRQARADPGWVGRVNHGTPLRRRRASVCPMSSFTSAIEVACLAAAALVSRHASDSGRRRTPVPPGRTMAEQISAKLAALTITVAGGVSPQVDAVNALLGQRIAAVDAGMHPGHRVPLRAHER